PPQGCAGKVPERVPGARPYTRHNRRAHARAPRREHTRPRSTPDARAGAGSRRSDWPIRAESFLNYAPAGAMDKGFNEYASRLLFDNILFGGDGNPGITPRKQNPDACADLAALYQ